MAAFTKVIMALILGIAAGVGGQSGGADHVRDRLPREAGRTFAERPSGEWVATGRVLEANRAAGRSVGEVLKRRWRFETRCADGADGVCRMYLLRTTAGGVESSVLHLHRGVYVGEFSDLPSECELRPGVVASFGVTFSIWWTKNRSHLVAEEMGGFVDDPRCGTAGERIRWTARRHYGGSSEGADEVL